MIRVFNTEKLLDQIQEFPMREIKDQLQKHLSVKETVNVIFVTPKQIKKLNQEYREKDEVTDVLSFNIDTSGILGELYVCPEYIINTTDEEKLKEQLIRDFVHGILHLHGYDHKKKFREVDYKDEPMYIKQEEVLNKILKQVIQE